MFLLLFPFSAVITIAHIQNLHFLAAFETFSCKKSALNWARSCASARSKSWSLWPLFFPWRVSLAMLNQISWGVFFRLALRRVISFQTSNWTQTPVFFWQKWSTDYKKCPKNPHRQNGKRRRLLDRKGERFISLLSTSLVRGINHYSQKERPHLAAIRLIHFIITGGKSEGSKSFSPMLL